MIKHPPCWAPCGGKKHVHQEISHDDAAGDAPPPPTRSAQSQLVRRFFLRIRINWAIADDFMKQELCRDKYTVCDVMCCVGERRAFDVVRRWLDSLFVGSQDRCGSGPAFRTESVKLTLMGVNFYKHWHSTNLHTLTWMSHYSVTASESRLNPTWLISE